MTNKGTILSMPPGEAGQTSRDEKESSYYADLITGHIPFIEKQCRKAVEKSWKSSPWNQDDLALENEVLELSNRVLDTLRRQDFRILRQFKGSARLTTYLTAIIANQAVDIIRHKRGRSREKERARQIGGLGERLYDLAIGQGLPLAAAFEELKKEDGYTGSIQELQAWLDRIKGKARLEPNNPVVKPGTRNPETGELVVPDEDNNPENLVLNRQHREKVKEVLGAVISRLKGEERLILRMRFPGCGEKPREIEEIAGLLGISKKAVYHRVARILTKCRNVITGSGVQYHDLF